ncbi:aspartate aminotransferase family protein [Candidatus Woesearchaeota archaeon CG10_big_fil_rev_8_21_14_0_10_30_7]|nr:MAG: aspartate aminotransferase family protein [Candidatus Woesearchaeota archaeon CG10_big_fil_rev_8_21_14_0_10_30_7]
MNTKELEQKYEFDVYPKRDIIIIKGENAKVWDDRGKEYIDCVAGHGVVNIGHCNPKIIEAITEQSKKLITCSGIFYNDIRAKLLEKLINIAPENLTRAFLCNSGAESIEAAIKFARFTTKKTKFVCAMRGFHGRTLGALTATHNPKYKEDFEPLIPGFHHVPFNNFEKLKEQINENTAGVILEIVQGEGGVNIAKQEYLTQVKQLCTEKNILLIIDEIQTGFCRTGKMFACQNFNIQPDIMCLAKAIAGGIPMGAVLCSENIEVPLGRHGTTFGGNPLSCATAIATIEFMLENDLAEQARIKGDYFVNKLAQHNLDKIREIKQSGLMIGLELKEKAQQFLVKLMEKGVLALPAGPLVIRLLPPLTISYEELDFVVEKIVEVLG